MATLKELKDELRREKNKTAALKEIADIGKERRKIKEEIKFLRRQRKFARTIKVSRAISRTASAGAKAIGRAEQRDRQEKLRSRRTGVRQSSFEDTIMHEIPQ